MEGIVLKRISYQETSYILSTITNKEVLSLMIKGAKRKNSGKLALSEPLTLIDFETNKSPSFKTLTEGYVIDSFSEIKMDLDKLSIASVMAEYAYQVKDMDESFENIYGLLKNSLYELKDSKDPEIILFRFEIVLLYYFGLSPKEEYLVESYSAPKELIKSIDGLIKNDYTSLDRKRLREFFIDFYYRELGLKLKSKKLYLDMR